MVYLGYGDIEAIYAGGPAGPEIPDSKAEAGASGRRGREIPGTEPEEIKVTVNNGYSFFLYRTIYCALRGRITV